MCGKPIFILLISVDFKQPHENGTRKERLKPMALPLTQVAALGEVQVTSRVYPLSMMQHSIAAYSESPKREG